MVNIKEVFFDYGIEINEIQEKQFIDYYNLLIEYNKVMNLTSITDFNDVVVKHFLDSILPFSQFKQNSKVIDVGTGAGFPAIPLKIVRPDLEFTLVDSLNKRIKFLNEVITKLNLKDISAIHSRSEDLAHNVEFRENYDYCVSRAVAKLNTLLELCIPFIRIGGEFIAYKSSNIEDEIKNAKNAFKLLNCNVIRNDKYILPYNYGDRNILIIKKTKTTNNIYPRNNNNPKNKPL